MTILLICDVISLAAGASIVVCTLFELIRARTALGLIIALLIVNRLILRTISRKLKKLASEASD
jgi:hypothetical protein